MRTVSELYRLIDNNILDGKLFIQGIEEFHDLAGLFEAAGNSDSQVILDANARSLTVTGKLNFSGETVDFKGDLTQASAMRYNFTLGGSLRPDLIFKIDGIDWFKLNTLSVFFNTALISFSGDSGMGDISLTNGGLKGFIELQQAELTASVDFPNGDNTLWVLNAALVLNGGANLEILSELCGDDSWINLMPDNLKVQFSLLSLDLKVKFDRRQKTVPLFFVTAGLEPYIDLLNNGMASFDDLKVFFVIRNATDPEKRRAYSAVQASFKVLGVRFKVAGKLPDLYLTGNLIPENPLYLTELLAAYAPEYSVVLKQTGRDMMFHALSLRLDVPNKTFWLYAQSYMDWEIVPGKLVLAAPQMNLVVTAQKTEAVVTVCFYIDSNNRVILNARFQKDRALVFYGGIEQISIGSLVSGLANQLSLQAEVSSALFGLPLNDIQVSLDLAVERLAFDGALEIAGAQLRCIVTIDNGFWEAAVDICGRPFALELSAACDFRASWTATGPSDHLSFTAVAEAFGVTLTAAPDIAYPALEGATFAYDVAGKSLAFDVVLADYCAPAGVSCALQGGSRGGLIQFNIVTNDNTCA
ncbi:hypothetical protein F6R98_10925 [Candidatus Methylospira mobilis]|uniref:Uncharacterized protein n=1 Tax=Candidatus Methylospira mobilis TaxID=1808979 RepID=A0A5Q0BLT8_9GAMM|nr:hypothetical protein [Candidatus Methylospira mobilis]QFY43067.1 hypothetical protein F6R98_10925 [Candidatus Methylospira mobilis]